MPFPVEPRSGQDPAEFLIEDPFGVRQSIVPLLTRNRTTGNLTGMGTAFCVDPYRSLLTAQHIFEEIDLTRPPPDFEEIPFAMLAIGVVFGTVGLPPDLFAPVIGMGGFVDLSPKDPLHALIPGMSGPKMIADCLRLHLGFQSEDRKRRLEPLPLCCRATPPAIGERLLAIGYPELGAVRDEPMPSNPLYKERMYGAIGEVVAIHPHGLGRSRPWPTIEVRANWRSGMSGGPLFNEAGEIVGLVSSSLEPDESGWGTGFAVWFGGFPLQNLIPWIDPANPGHYRGFGIVREKPWHLAGICPDEASARTRAKALGPDYEVYFGSNRYGSDDFVYTKSAPPAPG